MGAEQERRSMAEATPTIEPAAIPTNTQESPSGISPDLNNVVSLDTWKKAHHPELIKPSISIAGGKPEPLKPTHKEHWDKVQELVLGPEPEKPSEFLSLTQSPAERATTILGSRETGPGKPVDAIDQAVARVLNRTQEEIDKDNLAAIQAENAATAANPIQEHEITAPAPEPRTVSLLENVYDLITPRSAKRAVAVLGMAGVVAACAGGGPTPAPTELQTQQQQGETAEVSPTTSENPTIVLPSAPPPPESTATPEMSLHDKLTAFTEGKLPISDKLFKLDKYQENTAPLGLVKNETTPIGKQYEFQGQLIGEEVVYDKNGQNPRLIAYIGFKGVDYYYLAFDFGRLNSNDKTQTASRGDIIEGTPDAPLIQNTYTPTQLQEILKQYNGTNIVITSVVDNVDQGVADDPSASISVTELVAANKITAEMATVCSAAQTKPIKEVPMSNQLADIINKPIEQFTSPLPKSVGLLFYS